MKYILTFFVVFSLLTTGVCIAVKAADTPPADIPEREYPIAAGVWYPGDGPIPDKPMRYYRVRCWPGCHTGSSLGMYPDTRLEDDTPVFPTSTIDRTSHDRGPRN